MASATVPIFSFKKFFSSERCLMEKFLQMKLSLKRVSSILLTGRYGLMLKRINGHRFLRLSWKMTTLLISSKWFVAVKILVAQPSCNYPSALVK